MSEIISDFKNVKIKNKKIIKKDLLNFNSDLTTEKILQKCCEMDVMKVFTIDLRCEKLSVIPNIKDFKHLKVLDVSSNRIKILNNLENLNELKELKVFDNQLENLSGLSGLKELVVLQAQYNKIGALDSSTLTSLRKLKQLRVDNNMLREVTLRDVSSCSNLTYLDVSFNFLKSISFVSCLPNLEELYATNNQLEVIPNLSRCKKLSELRLCDNVIENVGGLKDHPSLTILDLSGNNLSSFQSLGCLQQLESLNVSRNRIVNVETILTSCPNLEILNLAHNQMKNLEECLKYASNFKNLCELIFLGNSFPIINEETQEQYTYQKISDHIPQLKMLDNITLKKPESYNPNNSSILPMRPMTAAAGLSLRQIESQLKEFANDMVDIQSKTDATYKEVLKSLMSTIPDDLTIDLTHLQETLSASLSLKSARSSRLKDALLFASTNYCDDV